MVTRWLAKIPLALIELMSKLSEASLNFRSLSPKLCVTNREHFNEWEKGDRLTNFLEGGRNECMMHKIYEEIVREARYNT